MRIQHNIMAMNAYRNYTRNTSALSKNLEKLSSGYKINRAGDDAAGLAISEKMRAQITGLEAAQKNVKDGISLVNTAEGAMQEVQDMLNRMVYLAQESANGTYDNEVDRMNLQKEMDQLNAEIDRIADSANFNGIKLLDGSLDSNKDMTTKMDFAVGKGLPGVGLTLGVDTVLHSAVVDPTEGSKFSIDLHDYEFNNQKGDTMNITIGDTKIELTRLTDNANTDDALKGADLATAILAGTTNDYSVKVDGNIYNAGDSMYFGGQEFTVSDAGKGRINFAQAAAPTDPSEDVDPSMKVTIGGKVQATSAKFSFDTNGWTLAATDVLHLGDEDITAGGTGVSDVVDAINANSKYYKAEATGTKITVTAKTGGPKDTPAISISKAAADGTVVATNGSDGTLGIFTITVAAGDTITIDGHDFAQGTGGFDGTATEVTVDGIKYNVTGDITGAGTTLTLTEKTVVDGQTVANDVATLSAPTYTKTNGGTTTTSTATAGTAHAASSKEIYKYDLATAWTGGKITILGKDVQWNGVDAASSIQDAIDAGELNFDNFDVSVTDGSKLTLTSKKPGAAATTGIAALTDADLQITNGKDFKVAVEQKGADAVVDPTKGDYNVSTTVLKKVSAADTHRLASTYFDLTMDMATEGSKLTIADQTFTFTADAANKDKAGYVDISSGDINTIAQKLTDAAKQNHVYTVGHDGARITLTETLDHDAEYVVSGKVVAPADGWDLRTADGIAKSLSFTAGTTKTGTPLTLQIGDTSDGYNQLKVSIGDIHAEALGTASLSIADQASAAAAVDKIKDAINTVSSIRGTLGATSNRLDHTANNLSVMRENITDAESAIRDTDIAEEMMAYTKNNILVQSAQAMLAQANQVPQGVLQLLQ